MPLLKCVCFLFFIVTSMSGATAQESKFANGRDSIPYYSSSNFLVLAGPRNYDTSKYAIIVLYRPSTPAGGNLWFSVVGDSEEIARISILNRFLVKIPREGMIKIETRYHKESSVDLNVRFGQTYYIRVEATLEENIVFAKLTLVPKVQGIEENMMAHWTDNYIDYPWTGDMHHVEMYANVKDEPNYVVNIADPIQYYEGKFYPPSSARFYYVLRNAGLYNLPHFHFVYKNYFLSRTFFKEINIFRIDKEFEDLADLETYVEKSSKGGKKLINNKKDSIVEFKYERFPEFGDFAAGFHAAIKEEKELKDKTSIKSLWRIYVIYIIKKPAKRKKAFPIIGPIHGVAVLISESGLPEEVHSVEEIREEITRFCSGISF